VIKPIAQGAALAAAVWLLLRTSRLHWDTLVAVRLTVQWGWLAGGSILWLGSFVCLVRLWAASLNWWQQRLDFRAALSMFVLTNLARYIPGTIWQFAGLAAFAVAERVSPVAAASAVLLQQLVLLGTGVLLSLALAPAFLSPAAAALPPWAALVIVVAGLVLLMSLFPVALPALQRRLEALLHRTLPMPQPPAAGFARYVVGSTLGWLGYGASFWLFARAVLGAAAPGPVLAATAFIASYVAGIIAVFAPGGIVVRETALVAALGSHIGREHAFLLAVSARLWLVALEILVAAVVIAVSRLARRSSQGGGPPADQGLRNTKTN